MAVFSKDLLEEFRKQLHEEMASAWLYLKMANWCDLKSLHGFSHWFYQQWEEEREHMNKFRHFMLDRDEDPMMPDIEMPDSEWTDLGSLWDATVEHEVYITERIDKLADIAVKDKDHGAHEFLLEFAKEQIEEVDMVRDIRDRVKMCGDNPAALLDMDREVGSRS